MLGFQPSLVQCCQGRSIARILLTWLCLQNDTPDTIDVPFRLASLPLLIQPPADNPKTVCHLERLKREHNCKRVYANKTEALIQITGKSEDAERCAAELRQLLQECEVFVHVCWCEGCVYVSVCQVWVCVPKALLQKGNGWDIVPMRRLVCPGPNPELSFEPCSGGWQRCRSVPQYLCALVASVCRGQRWAPLVSLPAGGAVPCRSTGSHCKGQRAGESFYTLPHCRESGHAVGVRSGIRSIHTAGGREQWKSVSTLPQCIGEWICPHTTTVQWTRATGSCLGEGPFQSFQEGHFSSLKAIHCLDAFFQKTFSSNPTKKVIMHVLSSVVKSSF